MDIQLCMKSTELLSHDNERDIIMMKRYNYRIIKIHRIYTTTEAAKLLKVHPRTVQNWILKEGLKVVDPNAIPYLIRGEDLSRFIKNKMHNRKCKLQANQFYCLQCKCARESKSNKVKVIYTGKKYGSGIEMLSLIGNCSKCGETVRKYWSSSRLIELIKAKMILTNSHKIKTNKRSKK